MFSSGITEGTAAARAPHPSKYQPLTQNMISDGRTLVHFIKSKFHPSQLTLYGRSIGGHVARALHPTADLLILDRSFTSIGLIPRFKLGRWAQRVCDFMLDNYEYNVQGLVGSQCGKILIYDPRQDEVVGYMASLTVGLTAELARRLYSRKGTGGKERVRGRLGVVRRLEAVGMTEEYYQAVVAGIEYYKFVLNERDTRLFFLASRRLIRACFFRAELDKDPAHKNRMKMMEFASPPVLDDLEVELLDQDTLSSIHSDQRSLAANKNITSECFDYSQQLSTQPDRERAMNILDNVRFASPDLQRAVLHRVGGPAAARDLLAAGTPAGTDLQGTLQSPSL